MMTPDARASRWSVRRLISWPIVVLLVAVPCAAQQQAAFEDVVRNLRNPDVKARMNALQLLHESRHVEAAVPVAPLLTDPVDAIQLEAIAAELSFFLVQDIPVKKRVGLVVEGNFVPNRHEVHLGPLVARSRAAMLHCAIEPAAMARRLSRPTGSG